MAHAKMKKRRAKSLYKHTLEKQMLAEWKQLSKVVIEIGLTK